MALHYNIITGQEPVESVKKEFKNMYSVLNMYKQTFLKTLFSKFPEIDISVQEDAKFNIEDSSSMKNLCDEIKNKIGLENYKKFIEEYNLAIENLSQSGKLPTPEELLGDFNNVRKELRQRGEGTSDPNEIVNAENTESKVPLFDLITEEMERNKNSNTVTMESLVRNALGKGITSNEIRHAENSMQEEVKEITEDKIY